MEDPTKDQIIHRAYELWEQAGKPEGKDKEFYHQAEEELRKGVDPRPLLHLTIYRWIRTTPIASVSAGYARTIPTELGARRLDASNLRGGEAVQVQKN